MYTNVQVIRRKAGLLLVEWQENELPKRAWVASDMVVRDNGDRAVVENPGAGVPYGVEFWRLLNLEAITPQDVDKELKRRGIWTVADLRSNPNVALAAIQKVLGFSLATLLEAANQYEQDLSAVVDGKKPR